MPDSHPPVNAAEVARLAKIELDPAHLEQINQQLAEILQFVGQLQQVDLPPETEPFFGATLQANAVREDQVHPSLPPKQALANAPRTDGEFYLVPPVFGS